MTVDMIVEQLKQLPEDVRKQQIRDTYGSPICYFVKKGNEAPDGAGVYLEPISEMDVDEYLRSFIEESVEEGMEEHDIFYELGKIGFTLKDFEGTDYYEMAKEITKNTAWY